MTVALTFAYLAIAISLFWHSASSPNRSPLHRAMLYAFGLAAMCFGTARFMVLAGSGSGQWLWIFELGHFALVAFAVMWIGREISLKDKLERKGP